jgi:hypothetical protein
LIGCRHHIVCKTGGDVYLLCACNGTAAKVRKQDYVKPEQERFLRNRAREIRIPEAELIRQAVDLLVQTPATHSFDAEAWADEEAMLDRRAGANAERSTPWRLRRDEIYQERLGRVPG